MRNSEEKLLTAATAPAIRGRIEMMENQLSAAMVIPQNLKRQFCGSGCEMERKVC